MEGGGTDANKIAVAIRVRPPNRQESACQLCTCCDANTITLQRGADVQQNFSFDHVYSSNSTNEQLFDDLGTELLRNAWLGVSKSTMSIERGHSFFEFRTERSALGCSTDTPHSPINAQYNTSVFAYGQVKTCTLQLLSLLLLLLMLLFMLMLMMLMI
jgi:hypothetical protein